VNASYLLANGLGSLMGPILMGIFVDRFGLSSIFHAGFAAVFGVILFWRICDAFSGQKRFAKSPHQYSKRRRIAA
ncbi:MAG: hypothetical protein ACKO23_10895, partial [Gemmataceae bacterium]